MKNYKDLSPSIQLMLEDAVASDPYGLSPETLYKNIVNSTGTDEFIAKIFEVSVSLVMMIREENNA